MNTFLSIAAADTSGGAGIQQDLKMAQLLGFWGVNVITALTAQSFEKVYHLEPVSEDMFIKQLEVVIDSFDISAVKIGVVPSLRFAELIVESIKKIGHHKWCPYRNGQNRPIVYDPVLASTSGFVFTPENAREMIKTICSVATVITPNIPELCFMYGDDWEKNIESLADTFGCAVYVKGGHGESDVITEHLIQKEGVTHHFLYDKYDWKYSHGTGCAFSSLLSMSMVDNDLPTACVLAREKLVEVYNP